MMTFQQLRYALAVARYGSISEAAKHMFVSQPSLSQAIKDLEAEYGIVLFARTARGASATRDGEEFLSYAAQILEQAELLEARYGGSKNIRRISSVSTQHYAFAVQALVHRIRIENADEYEITLRECRTAEIIEDVANFRSEIGVLYLSDFNSKVLRRLFADRGLEFHELFAVKPKVFVRKNHPLESLGRPLCSADLLPFPFLCFEQGIQNSFHFSEEPLATERRPKTIRVSDRATLFNCLIGLDGYTICTGVIDNELNDIRISVLPLESDEIMHVGYLLNPKAGLSDFGRSFIEELGCVAVSQE